MSAVKTFEDYLTNQVPQVDLGQFIIGLGITGIMGVLLAWTYSKFGKSHSNRSVFATNFILTAMATMLVITVVKSSLALSLGLVGALSIVRFRTAIKDPEELSFLFISIAIGLGMGADQKKITLVGFAIILIGYIIFRMRQFKWAGSTSMHLLLTSDKAASAPLKLITDSLPQHAVRWNLKRVSEGASGSELSFLVEFKDITSVQNLRDELKKHVPDWNINLMEYQGLFD
jgi:hypothetical protein